MAAPPCLAPIPDAFPPGLLEAGITPSSRRPFLFTQSERASSQSMSTSSSSWSSFQSTEHSQKGSCFCVCLVVYDLYLLPDSKFQESWHQASLDHSSFFSIYHGPWHQPSRWSVNIAVTVTSKIYQTCFHGPVLKSFKFKIVAIFNWKINHMHIAENSNSVRVRRVATFSYLSR